MKRPLAWLTAAILIGGAVVATRWPQISDVTTGETPEYPDLIAQRFTAGEERVTRAAKAAVAALPGWELIGSGRGPGGSELQAVATTRVLRFKDDVTIRIRRREGLTEVTVRSRSRVGKGDFGQNARNVRAFQAELERQMSMP